MKRCSLGIFYENKSAFKNLSQKDSLDIAIDEDIDSYLNAIVFDGDLNSLNGLLLPPEMKRAKLKCELKEAIKLTETRMFIIINDEIAPIVAQRSTSLDNTRENSNAAGLQIGDNVNPDGILASAGALSGRLAKQVFSSARKLEASSFCNELLSQ